MEITPQIFTAKVMHKRLFPKVNQFVYGTYYLALPLQQLTKVNDGWRIGYNRKSLLTIHDKDHGAKDGSWEGNVGTLKEDFTYYTGNTQQRVWTITQQPDGTYEGTASDIIDKARGASNGSAIQWAYRMDLDVDGATYRVSFDDWMWQMNDGVMINRSYIKKFGFTVAELTLFMQKQ